MTSLAAQYAATTVWLGSHQWSDPTEAEMRAMDAERGDESEDES